MAGATPDFDAVVIGAGFSGGYDKTGDIELLVHTIRRAVPRRAWNPKAAPNRSAASLRKELAAPHPLGSGAWGRKWPIVEPNVPLHPTS